MRYKPVTNRTNSVQAIKSQKVRSEIKTRKDGKDAIDSLR